MSTVLAFEGDDLMTVLFCRNENHAVIMGFAVLSNHLNVVARTRPDLVKTWSDDDVAVRWWNLFPQRRLKDGLPAEHTEYELNHIRNDASGLKEKQKRLSSVSWFMKCLCEPIAKRGNREEEVTGHFWASHFRTHPLLDEIAIAACLAYVDLQVQLQVPCTLNRRQGRNERTGVSI